MKLSELFSNSTRSQLQRKVSNISAQPRAEKGRSEGEPDFFLEVFQRGVISRPKSDLFQKQKSEDPIQNVAARNQYGLTLVHSHKRTDFLFFELFTFTVIFFLKTHFLKKKSFSANHDTVLANCVSLNFQRLFLFFLFAIKSDSEESLNT